MKDGKSNNIIIIILSVIIVLLVTVIVLMSIEKINFLSNNNDENGILKEEKLSIKIDDSLDYVYDATYVYDNEYTSYFNVQEEIIEIDYFGLDIRVKRHTLSALKVPYINIKSDDAKKINKQLENLYLDYAKSFDEYAKVAKTIENDPFFGVIHTQILTYFSYQYDNNLSVVVVYDTQATSPWVLNYHIYNFDLNTGNLLTYDEMLSKLGYEKEQTLLKMETLLKNKMDELYGNHVGDMSKACHEIINDNGDFKEISCYDKANELLENSIEDNSILFFVDNEGNLNVLVNPYYDGVQNGDINKYLLEITK